MINRLDTANDLAEAQGLRHMVAVDEVTFSPRWLADSGAHVVAQESGRHLESGEALLVVRAFAAAGTSALVAIVNDSLAAAAEAYEIDVSEEALEQICADLVGVNFVLVDTTGQNCILFTAYDFKLIAGSLAFVTAIAGEPRAAREAFIEFAAGQPASLRATAARAAEYMKWVQIPE